MTIKEAVENSDRDSLLVRSVEAMIEIQNSILFMKTFELKDSFTMRGIVEVFSDLINDLPNELREVYKEIIFANQNKYYSLMEELGDKPSNFRSDGEENEADSKVIINPGLLKVLLSRVENFGLKIPVPVIEELSNFAINPGLGLAQIYDYLRYTKENSLERNAMTYSSYIFEYVRHLPGTDCFTKHMEDIWDEQKTDTGNLLDQGNHWDIVN